MDYRQRRKPQQQQDLGSPSAGASTTTPAAPGAAPATTTSSSGRPVGANYNIGFPRSLYQGRRSSSNTGDDALDLMERGEANNYNNESESYLPRLVLRNRPFGQSANKVHIEHNQGYRIYSLLKHNWFHAFLRWPSKISITMLMAAWTGSILIFALLYVWYDISNANEKCGLGQDEQPMTFGQAFAFSLETCTTVGYGIPHGLNAFFEKECGSLKFLIYLQMAFSMLFNAFLLAFLYARLGRSEARSYQVIKSRKALVSNVNGQVRFQVRLFDADAQHPVCEAHVRMYCVMNHRPVPRPLRLLQPDDDLGGMLFLSFPTVISHHIDLYSLLHPPIRVLEVGMLSPNGLSLRQADSKTNSRDDVICPVCGESYATLTRWKNHVRFNQIAEAKDDWPVEGSHLSLNMADVEEWTQNNRATRNMDELKEYFRQNVSEVICVVEGIDPLQSGTFQSLQSYRFEDIVWEEHSQWAPCLTIIRGDAQQQQTGDRVFQVDLDRYHDIVQDPDAIREAEEKKRAKEAVDEAKADISASQAIPTTAPDEGTSPDNPATPFIQPTLTAGAPKVYDTAADDSMPGLSAALERIFTEDVATGDDDGATAGDAPAVASGSGALPTTSKPPSHRRVKSSSRRPGDGLFTLDEELEKGSAKHPLKHAAKSMPS